MIYAFSKDLKIYLFNKYVLDILLIGIPNETDGASLYRYFINYFVYGNLYGGTLFIYVIF